MDGENLKTIIIVEDSTFFADLMIRLIKRSGLNANFRVVVTKSELQAALKNGRWDIILCDNIIPGFGILGALKVRNNGYKEIPFIIVSEDVGERTLNEAFKLGCEAYLPKDRISELPDLVQKMVHKSE